MKKSAYGYVSYGNGGLIMSTICDTIAGAKLQAIQYEERPSAWVPRKHVPVNRLDKEFEEMDKGTIFTVEIELGEPIE